MLYYIQGDRSEFIYSAQDILGVASFEGGLFGGRILFGLVRGVENR